MTMKIKLFYRSFVKNMRLKWKKISTHREASIGLIKHVSPTIMLQTAIRSRIELVLCSTSFTEEDTKHLVTSTGRKKCKSIKELDSNEITTTESDGDCEYTPIYLPAFDLSTKEIITATGKEENLPQHSRSSAIPTIHHSSNVSYTRIQQTTTFFLETVTITL